ncbi:MAG: pyridoxal phosphate-dependent aminotransferase family protein [Patescibacteria group bacterium]
MEEIKRLYKYIKEHLKIPDQIILQSATGPEVKVGGRNILMFGSYNYLGLANMECIRHAAVEKINSYGVGSGGVRLLTGTMDIHCELEALVAKFTGHEDCLTIASGYGANVGVIPGVINLMGFGKSFFARKAVIFSDEFNHASIVDGCKLSVAEIVIYGHNNIQDLERKIAKYKKHRKLIVTDGVFSMDGDIAPLGDILELAKSYGALTMVDDAHAFGVLGDTGAGTAEYFHQKGRVDINMGTFSKGIGVSGGFISGKSDLIDYLRLACRSYMFSDSLSPAIVGAVIAAINFIKTNVTILKDLQEKSDYFRHALNQQGYHTFNSKTQVVPLFVGDEIKSLDFARRIYNAGVFAPAIRWPAVPKNSARIRFAICASHSYEQIDRALEVVLHVGSALGLKRSS